ncbi:coq1 hexaprenyl diphosphate synthase [Salix suchowensis]|nr:coq1 hexaprenyl diphosphate synthase [Salix suchowensis]
METVRAVHPTNGCPFANLLPTSPFKANPDYKGKWYAPLIDNPAYKGEWAPRRSPTLPTLRISRPSRGGVGIELWTMTEDILFDNIYVGHSVDDAKALAAATFEILTFVDAAKIDPLAAFKTQPETGAALAVALFTIFGMIGLPSASLSAKKTDAPTPDSNKTDSAPVAPAGGEKKEEGGAKKRTAAAAKSGTTHSFVFVVVDFEREIRASNRSREDALPRRTEQAKSKTVDPYTLLAPSLTVQRTKASQKSRNTTSSPLKTTSTTTGATVLGGDKWCGEGMGREAVGCRMRGRWWTGRGIGSPLSRPDVLNDWNPNMPDHTRSFDTVFELRPPISQTPRIQLPPDFASASVPGLSQSLTLLPTQLRLAQIVEMIHVASLLHDDVIDKSLSARRCLAPSAFGNKLTVLGGDFLLGRASTLYRASGQRSRRAYC